MCVFCPGQGTRDHPSLRQCFEDLLHVPPRGEVFLKEPKPRGWRAQGVVLGYALRARGLRGGREGDFRWRGLTEAAVSKEASTELVGPTPRQAPCSPATAQPL